VEQAARARAAEALRRFGHELHRRDADDELLLRVAAAADDVTRALQSAPVRVRDEQRMRTSMFDQDTPEGQRIVHFEECVVSGPWNPMGIGIEVHREGDDAVADVTLGWAWEGAPGRAHGGIVAAIFDDVLGYLLSFLRQPAYTGELSVRYLAPTPIDVPVRFRARVVSRGGRKIDSEATAHRIVDGVEQSDPIATATARFITIERYGTGR
jgi:acyl-coenzyme A thioesterase PaaI-like protein